MTQLDFENEAMGSAPGDGGMAVASPSVDAAKTAGDGLGCHAGRDEMKRRNFKRIAITSTARPHVSSVLAAYITVSKPSLPDDQTACTRPEASVATSGNQYAPSGIGADQPRPSRAEAEQAVHTLLSYIGENPGREGLLDTPRRVVEAFDELYQGYHQCPAEVLDRTFGETAGYDDFVLVRDIEFTSQCEHHMMPFYGRAHIAYTPVERVVGLSKLARLTDIFARRLQTQEHLTAQIAAAIDEILKPRGVAVLVEAEHTCMSVRGVAKHGAMTFTSRYTGMFRDNPAEQSRFLSMVRAPQR